MGLVLKVVVALLAALVVCVAAVLIVFPDRIVQSLPSWIWAQTVDGGPQILFEVEPEDAQPPAVEETITVIERRLHDLLGTKPSVQPEGSARIVVQVPRSVDVKRVIEVATRPGKLEFRMVDTSMSAEQAARGQPPVASEVLYGTDRQPLLIEKRVPLSGREIVEAQAGFDQRTNEPVVAFRFSSNGTRRFGLLTRENVGRPFAIVLDNTVVSAPIIREPIVGGSGQISGNFTVQQANDLALLLRAGALPARLKVIEERPAQP